MCSVVKVSEDSLQCEVAMRTGAEVLGVVQTNHLARTAGAGDARQVAGGPTLVALLLLVWERLVINLLRLHHTLGIQIYTRMSFRGDTLNATFTIKLATTELCLPNKNIHFDCFFLFPSQLLSTQL